jgi:hypothetical protein
VNAGTASKGLTITSIPMRLCSQVCQLFIGAPSCVHASLRSSGR